MADVSHNGAIYTISASNTTLNIPIPITAFPKDTDPFSVSDTDIGDMEIGTNGGEIFWSTQNPVETSVSIIPATEDHELMQRIYSANRAQDGKRSAGDKITIARTLPNGELTMFFGRITGGPATTSLTSAGKIKTPVYSFMFSKVVRTPAINIEVAI